MSIVLTDAGGVSVTFSRGLSPQSYPWTERRNHRKVETASGRIITFDGGPNVIRNELAIKLCTRAEVEAFRTWVSTRIRYGLKPFAISANSCDDLGFGVGIGVATAYLDGEPSTREMISPRDRAVKFDVRIPYRAVVADGPSPVEDLVIDGVAYPYATIGSQVWMTQNLYAKVGTWQYPNLLPENEVGFGLIYNKAAALSLAPAGWHLPSESDYETLIDFAGGAAAAGGNLKASGTSYWGTGGSDLYGFNARGAGFTQSGVPYSFKAQGYYMVGTSTSYPTDDVALVFDNSAGCSFSGNDPVYGTKGSVRYIKD